MNGTIPLRDHMAIRLSDLRGDGKKAIEASFQAITRQQSAARMLASGNTIHKLEAAIEETYRATLNDGASFVAEATGGQLSDHIDLVDPFARTFQGDLLRAYGNVFDRLGLRGGEPSFRSRGVEVRAKLETIHDRFIGDFKIGMIGGKWVSATAKNQNSVSFDGANINAPVFVSQSINHSGLDQETLKFLGHLLQSGELAELPAEAKDAAEAVQDELAKPAPNKGKVMRWLISIGSYAGQLGKDALSAAVKELAKEYAKQAGLPPP